MGKGAPEEGGGGTEPDRLPDRHAGVNADPPRLPERHADLGADDPHIPFQVAQLDRAEGQTLTLQPPQVIHQVIRVGLLRARALVLTQEPVRLRVQRALGPDDRP